MFFDRVQTNQRGWTNISLVSSGYKMQGIFPSALKILTISQSIYDLISLGLWKIYFDNVIVRLVCS